MPETPGSRKDHAFKALAIVGVVAVLALCVFAAVKLVSLVPTIFSLGSGPEVDVVDETDTEDDPSSVVIIDEPRSIDDEDETPGRVSGDSTSRPATTTPSRPSTPRPTPQPETYTETYTYIPTSNPNGYTDLATRVVGVGYIRSGRFVTATRIDNSDTAAIQIEIKNIGTKTSERFDLDIELPTGNEYSLDDEAGLKPNERVILTVSFDPKDLEGIESFDGEVSVSRDTKTNNNRFSGTMRFED